jgi:hypothetical protein
MLVPTKGEKTEKTEKKNKKKKNKNSASAKKSKATVKKNQQTLDRLLVDGFGFGSKYCFHNVSCLFIVPSFSDCTKDAQEQFENLFGASFLEY